MRHCDPIKTGNTALRVSLVTMLLAAHLYLLGSGHCGGVFKSAPIELDNLAIKTNPVLAAMDSPRSHACIYQNDHQLCHRWGKRNSHLYQYVGT